MGDFLHQTRQNHKNQFKVSVEEVPESKVTEVVEQKIGMVFLMECKLSVPNFLPISVIGGLHAITMINERIWIISFRK